MGKKPTKPVVPCIGKPQLSHAAPRTQAGSIFKKSTPVYDVPTYVETGDGRILKVKGSLGQDSSVPTWNNGNPDYTPAKSTVKTKHVSVTTVPDDKHPNGRLVVTIGACPPKARTLSPKQAPTVTKKQARGTWDPSIGSEPMNPVTHPSLQCPKR